MGSPMFPRPMNATVKWMLLCKKMRGAPSMTREFRQRVTLYRPRFREEVRRHKIRSDTIVSAEQYMTKRTIPRILFLLPALLFSADSIGVRPLVDRSQYAVAMFNQSLALAAELVPADKVRKQFGSEVDSRYLVVE